MCSPDAARAAQIETRFANDEVALGLAHLLPILARAENCGNYVWKVRQHDMHSLFYAKQI